MSDTPLKTAVYVGTRNMYPHMAAAAKSVICNSDIDEVYFLCEDSEFPYELPGMIHVIDLSKQPWFSPHGPNFRLKWTWTTLLRAALAKIFPDFDLILSLDDDTLAIGDISGIWDLPIGDNYFSASREPLKSKGGRYCEMDMFTQMGVVLYNLRQIREDHLDDRVIAELNARFCPFAEQTVFNEMCQGRILDMPSRYNACAYTEPCDTPLMLHYAAIPVPGWKDRPEVIQYRDMSWDEVMRRHRER